MIFVKTGIRLEGCCGGFFIEGRDAMKAQSVLDTREYT